MKIRIIQTIVFLFVAALVSCKKNPETGFSGIILWGKGSCNVIFDQGFGRVYDKYDGNVYFVPFSVVQKAPLKKADDLQKEGIKIKSTKGKVNVELNPGIYILMLEGFYSPEADKIIKISSGELVQENISFWICE